MRPKIHIIRGIVAAVIELGIVFFIGALFRLLTSRRKGKTHSIALADH